MVTVLWLKSIPMPVRPGTRAADAVAGRAPYPISMDEMVHAIAAFDAIVRSIESGRSERT